STPPGTTRTAAAPSSATSPSDLCRRRGPFVGCVGRTSPDQPQVRLAQPPTDIESPRPQVTHPEGRPASRAVPRPVRPPEPAPPTRIPPPTTRPGPPRMRPPRVTSSRPALALSALALALVLASAPASALAQGSHRIEPLKQAPPAALAGPVRAVL